MFMRIKMLYLYIKSSELKDIFNIKVILFNAQYVKP